MHSGETRKNQPRVTVITAVHNGMPFLPETLGCIRAQTVEDWEYLVVDDASEDDTVANIEAASNKDPRIRLIRRETCGGPFIAANTGLREARGRYLLRIDADDLSPPHRIQSQLDFLAAHIQYRACISPWTNFDKKGPIPGSLNPIPTRPRVLRWYLLLRTFASHSSLFIERACLEELGGYRERPVSQDFNLVSTLVRRGWLGIVPEVLSFVRKHNARISAKRRNLQLELSLEIMAEHLKDIAGESWPPEDLESLWLAGHWRPCPVDRGLRIIDQWEQLYRKDPALDGDDHRQLQEFSRWHQWKFLKVNWRKKPLLAGYRMARLILQGGSTISQPPQEFPSLK